MKNKTYNRLSIISLILILMFLALTLFVGFQISIQEQRTYAFDETQIDYYDDYLDYLEANPDGGNGLNGYIASVSNFLIKNIDKFKDDKGFSLSLSVDGFSELLMLSSEDRLRVIAGAFNVIKFDDPELFFIDYEKISVQQSLLSITIGTDYNTSCYIDEILDRAELAGVEPEVYLDEMIVDLRAERDKIVSSIEQECKTDYEKVCQVNDYIVRSVSYDTTASDKDNIVHTVYGSLIEGKAVCDGYSYAVQYLLDKMEITNLVCAGTSYNYSAMKDEGHMWSYVRLYNHWYGLDTTWNDPIGATDETNMRNYFLLGGNQTFKTGFYQRRTVSNYQISFSSGSESLYYELPIPTIENTKFVNPKITEIQIVKTTENNITTKVDINIIATNVLDDMQYAYAFSSDNGLTFGEMIFCNDKISFTEASENGTYRFYLISSDGEVVGERLFLKDDGKEELCVVDIGQTHQIVINCSDASVKWDIFPNKTQYYEGEFVQIKFYDIPIGYMIDEVLSEEVSINCQSEQYFFNMPTKDVTINVTLKEKEYNITIKNPNGVQYSLTKLTAKMGEEVELVVTELPKGKEILNIYGVEFNEEIAGFNINEPYVFTMPAKDVEIEIELQDIKYNITTNNTTDYEIKDVLTYAIYEQQVVIEVLDVPKDIMIIAEFDSEVEYTQNRNNIIIFTMPDRDVGITLSVRSLQIHSITILPPSDSEIEYNISANQGYFGEEIAIEILSKPDNCYILSIGNEEIVCEKIDNNNFVFVMPDDDVSMQFNIFNIPNVVVENTDVESSLEFIEENGDFYYLLSINSLPEGKYIKNIFVYDTNGEIKNVVTKINDSTYKILLEDKDLKISFELSDKAQLTGGDLLDQQIILIFVIFVLSVCFIALIIYIFSNGWKKRDY